MTHHRNFYISNTTGDTSGAGFPYPSGAHTVVSVFSEDHIARFVQSLVFCVLFSGPLFCCLSFFDIYDFNGPFCWYLQTYFISIFFSYCCFIIYAEI